eukprot:gb/GECH01000328.1/.p1 GENE.gb/GECH01000328.1/~~gb/GECH01000328.1/.p1  ORF type:complete len:572 (+),score=78.98 gb/GECH01000328.1/:1-1716(+)
MGSLHKESIQVIAQMRGINKLPDDIAQAIASDVEYRLREVIQDSSKFMRHSKRKTLTTDDVNNALRMKNVEPLYGFSTGEGTSFRRIPHTDLFFLEDPEVDVSHWFKTGLPRVPWAPSVAPHWLAIEGIQPRIPENPVLPAKEGPQGNYNTLQHMMKTMTSGELEGTEPPAKKARKASNTSEEGVSSKTEESSDKGVPPETTVLDGESGSDGEKGRQVKQLVKHVVSAELQKYYEKVTEAIKSTSKTSGSVEMRRIALETLATTPGVHQLLPYFCRFVVDEVAANLRSLDTLCNLMELVRALLANPHVHIELYLHQLMPAILTCLVGKRLCHKDYEDHWRLRDMAAEIVASICRSYGTAYHTLQPRITKTMLHAFLDTERPHTTHYGAIVGLTALGPHVTQLLLLEPPRSCNLVVFVRMLGPHLLSDSPVQRLEAMKCYGALLRAATTLFVRIGRILNEERLQREAQHLGVFVEEDSDEEEESADIMRWESSSPSEKSPPPENMMRKRLIESKMSDQMNVRYTELYQVFGEGLMPSIPYDVSQLFSQKPTPSHRSGYKPPELFAHASTLFL